MKMQVVVHRAPDGTCWAEVPAIPGCKVEGKTFEDLLPKLYEAVEARLQVRPEDLRLTIEDDLVEIVV